MRPGDPLNVFNFELTFRSSQGDGAMPLCAGAFSECSGLEATMEPKVLRVGGLNYGAVQLAGPVSFTTVVLKRGMTSSRDLFNWFQAVAAGGYSQRRTAEIAMRSPAGETVLTWGLMRCLPVKFKTADLNAKGGSDVAIEELQLAHEGLLLLATGGR
jgi:phage tail-like protein